MSSLPLLTETMAFYCCQSSRGGKEGKFRRENSALLCTFVTMRSQPSKTLWKIHDFAVSIELKIPALIIHRYQFLHPIKVNN